MTKQTHYDKILSAAFTVFHERGFHDSGTQDIVDLAGVSKGSFYNHFKSKDALGLAVLDFYWDSHGQSLRHLKAKDQPPLTRIQNYLESVGYDEKGCMVGNFSTEMAASDQFRTHISKLFKTWTTEVADCITDGQNDGTIRDNQSATELAQFVISSFEGTIMRAKVDRDPSQMALFISSITSFLKKDSP